MTRIGRTLIVLALGALVWAPLAAQGIPTGFQGPAIEQFLKMGKIVKMASIPVGVAAPRRATLELNGVQHQAVFKDIDVQTRGLQVLSNGKIEQDFEDSWRLEVAAYEVDKIIGLGLVPATVEREYDNKRGSMQWWIDDAMTEGDRVKKGNKPTDTNAWNRQQLNTRLFDNLIFNTDRTLANSLVLADFQIRLIDHSRTFRVFKDLRDPKTLTQFSRSLLDGLKKLDKANLTAATGKYVSQNQINTLLQRRDALLKLAADTIAKKGEAAVLFE